MRPSILGDRQSRQAEIRGSKRVPFFLIRRGENMLGDLVLAFLGGDQGWIWLLTVFSRTGFEQAPVLHLDASI